MFICELPQGTWEWKQLLEAKLSMAHYRAVSDTERDEGDAEKGESY